MWLVSEFCPRPPNKTSNDLLSTMCPDPHPTHPFPSARAQSADWVYGHDGGASNHPRSTSEPTLALSPAATCSSLRRTQTPIGVGRSVRSLQKSLSSRFYIPNTDIFPGQVDKPPPTPPPLKPLTPDPKEDRKSRVFNKHNNGHFQNWCP